MEIPICLCLPWPPPFLFYLHLSFSFSLCVLGGLAPLRGWKANLQHSVAQRSWSLTIPTERVAKANLATGNGDPSPFLKSVRVCVCVWICTASRAPVGKACIQHNTCVVLPHVMLSLTVISLVMWNWQFWCSKWKLALHEVSQICQFIGFYDLLKRLGGFNFTDVCLRRRRRVPFRGSGDFETPEIV